MLIARETTLTFKSCKNLITLLSFKKFVSLVVTESSGTIAPPN